MPNENIPTIEDFIESVKTVLIMQNSIMEAAKLMDAISEPLQTKICLQLMPATLTAVQFNRVIERLDPSILVPRKTESLQFADPPDPEIAQ